MAPFYFPNGSFCLRWREPTYIQGYGATVTTHFMFDINMTTGQPVLPQGGQSWHPWCQEMRFLGFSDFSKQDLYSQNCGWDANKFNCLPLFTSHFHKLMTSHFHKLMTWVPILGCCGSVLGPYCRDKKLSGGSRNSLCCLGGTENFFETIGT